MWWKMISCSGGKDKPCIFLGDDCHPIKINKDFPVLHPTTLFTQRIASHAIQERARFEGRFENNSFDEVHLMLHKLVVGIALEIFIGVPVKIEHCLVPDLRGYNQMLV